MPKHTKKQWNPDYATNARKDRADNLWYSNRYRSSKKFQTFEYQGNKRNYNNFVPPNLNYNNYGENPSANDSADVKLTPSMDKEKKEKRIITRGSLFENTYFSYNINDYDSSTDSEYPNNTRAANWTNTFWVNQNEGGTSGRPQSGVVLNINQNKVERRLNEMLAKPADMSKGKSLLQKMGWQGGGLGRGGDGIVEPIAPKATYAINTVGLGHPSEEKQNRFKQFNKMVQHQNKFSYKTTRKRNFSTNILLNILKFVKNDQEVELLFETHLSRNERKNIHQWVQKIREYEYLEQFENCSVQNLEIIKDIWIYNPYELLTESDGEKSERQLCLYKEALEHMFLILPSDLREDDEIGDKNANDDQTVIDLTINVQHDNSIDTINENEIEIDKQTNDNKNYINQSDVCAETQLENHEIENIDGNSEIGKPETILDKLGYVNSEIEKPETVCCLSELVDVNEDIDKHEVILGKLVKFFIAFSVDTKCTEFRFLGKFDREEVESVNLFFDICMGRDSSDSEEKIKLLEMLDNSVYEVQEDANGRFLISKSLTSNR